MAKPTITAVLPAKGHTGGRTLVEIQGTGFVVSPAPPDVLPAPAMPARARVTFGGIEADAVEVLDDGATIYAFTPIHDPGAVDVVVENLGETPASLLSGNAPFAITNGLTLELLVNGEAQTVTFVAADFAVSGAVTAAEAALALNRLRHIRATVQGSKVLIRTDARGPSSSLEVTGGTAAVALGFPASEQLGTEDLIPIEGEAVTAVAAYEFARPFLGKKLPVTLALEQLQVELRRQVIPEVSVATHSDFDLDTGDLLNTAILATLPAILVADVQLPESTMPVARVDSECAEGVNGVSVVREPDDLVDIQASLVVVSDSPIELFNLVAILRRFFRKNAGLVVPRDELDASKGTVTYPMQWEMGTPINVTAQRNGDNLQTATGLVSILGVPVGDIPIEYSGAMPTGVPVGLSYESVKELGWPRTQDTNVGLEPSG